MTDENPQQLDLQELDDLLREAWRYAKKGDQHQASVAMYNAVTALNDAADATFVHPGEDREDIGAERLPTIDLSNFEGDE